MHLQLDSCHAAEFVHNYHQTKDIRDLKVLKIMKGNVVSVKKINVSIPSVQAPAACDWNLSLPCN